MIKSINNFFTIVFSFQELNRKYLKLAKLEITLFATKLFRYIKTQKIWHHFWSTHNLADFEDEMFLFPYYVVYALLIFM